MTPPGGFVAPFRLDGFSGSFVWDANGYMAADFPDDDGEPLIRARGWGRIQRMPHADEVMDAWDAWLTSATAGAATPREAVAMMNAAASRSG